jgi:hypothetical protein
VAGASGSERWVVMVVDRDELAPGQEGTVRIEPFYPEFWVRSARA